MSDFLAIPLVLRATGGQRLVLGLPLWYRVVMALILAVVAAGLVQVGGRPGILAWTVLALLLVALLYQERWVFDAGLGRVRHQGGLVGAARTTDIPFRAIAGLRLEPHVRGTIPGSEDERRANAAALAGGRTDDGDRHRARHKRPYLGLVLECADGTRLLVDRVPARDADRLRQVARRLAEHCGRPLDLPEPIRSAR